MEPVGEGELASSLELATPHDLELTVLGVDVGDRTTDSNSLPHTTSSSRSWALMLVIAPPTSRISKLNPRGILEPERT